VDYSNGGGKNQISKQHPVPQQNNWKIASPSPSGAQQEPNSVQNSEGRSSPRTNMYVHGQMQSISSNLPLVKQ